MIRMAALTKGLCLVVACRRPGVVMPQADGPVRRSGPVEAVASAAASDPTWERLEDQLAWYDRKSTLNQRWYKQLKLVELAVAAALPVVAGLRAPAWAVGVLASLIVVLEGVQHLYQLQEHWITYRSTCEALRHERYLYLATAGPYAGAANPHGLLAERIESLVSQEHAKWASNEEAAGRTQPTGQQRG
jgi:hypothetical protein